MPHTTDCTKFYQCTDVNSQPCLCRCRLRNMLLDVNSGKCDQIREDNSCGNKRKLKEKADDKDFLGGLKKENDIIKSMSEILKEHDDPDVHLGTTVSPLELNTLNLTASNVIVIRDDFPVWAISFAVSAAVTVAVGVILFFY